MTEVINNTGLVDYQLTLLGIELANKVLCIADCDPDLLKNKHIQKALEKAKQWNSCFIDGFVLNRQGA